MMFDSCYIRPMEVNDVPMVLEWRNHPNTRRFMFTQQEIELNEHINWFKNANADDTRRLLIVEDGMQSIGYVQFGQVEIDGTAEWGFYVKPNAPSKSGRKLGVTALNYAFDFLGLHKICGRVLDFNEISRAFHLRMGFREEGVLREQIRIGDIYRDVYCFGLLANEWKAEEINRE